MGSAAQVYGAVEEEFDLISSCELASLLFVDRRQALNRDAKADELLKSAELGRFEMLEAEHSCA